MARKKDGDGVEPVVSKSPAGNEKKRGRKRAKHSDPSYTQMSVYIPIDLRLKVKIRLLEEDKEFSALVENLLREWLNR